MAQISGYGMGMVSVAVCQRLHLTRNSIHEYYKEFYTNDICKGEDGLKVCQYMKDQIKANDQFIKETVQRKSKDEPFWHMVNLFYQQMEGITEGWINKTINKDEELPTVFDTVYGIKLINYIADMFDYMEKFNLEANNEIDNNVSKPTCSVLIKYLKEQADLYVSHNTWHEYRAMGYRSVA